MKWDPNDEKDPQIVEKGGWFLLKNLEKAPNRSGVYIFVDDSEDVKYIGKAGARRLDEEIRNAINRGKNKGATRYGWLATNSNENALSLEQGLINKYNPPNNKT